MSGLRRSLIRRITPAAAIALSLALIPIVACSRGTATNTAARSDAGASPGSPQGRPTSTPPSAGAASAAPPPSASSPSAQAPGGQAAGMNDDMAVPPRQMKQMQPPRGALSAPQAGFDYSDFLGPATIEDGMETGAQTGNAAASAVSKVESLFGSNTPPPPSAEEAAVQTFRDEDTKIPKSEYSLAALAQTLPSDPIAIYRFVRDNVDIDGYDGIMRGPLGTWMSRAGSPSDKLVLMAWLLVTKGIPFQFVRGSLSADEQARVRRAIASPVATPGTFENARVRSTAQRYIENGTAFSSWVTDQLGKSKINVGTGGNPVIGSRHYWLEIDRDGHAFDLDPTLPDMNEGQHLATPDTSFKPWPMLPDDEWQYVQIRVAADFGDGTSQQLLVLTAKTPNVAYVPLRVAFMPHGSTDLSRIATARNLDAVLMQAGSVVETHALDLDAHGGVRQVHLEIRRKDIHGTIATSVRDLLPDGEPPAAFGPALIGLTTILIVPGNAANLFMVHEYLKTMAAVADAVAHPKDGRPKPTPIYPVRLGDYFSRDDVVATELTASAATRWYRSRPNVALQRTWFTVASGGAVSAITGFDIVDNTMAPAAGNSQQSARANLTRGYADTEIEHDVSGSGGPNGTIAIFEAAKASGVTPVVLIGSGDVPQELRPLARGIDATFVSGNVAIAPNKDVSLGGRAAYGWWDIDPATGNAVGRVTGGAGQDLSDYGYLLRWYSTELWILEMAQTAQECMGGGDCLKAICEAVVASIFAGAGWKHAAHVKSLNAFVAGIAMVVVGEFIGGKVVGSMCGGQPEGPGNAPPSALDDTAALACALR